MSIHSEGSIVLAANMACDLSGMVARYLQAYRKHCNGVNGVDVPSEFTVVLRPCVLDDASNTVMVSCTLVYTETHSYSVSQHYNCDDEAFSEAWGSSNVSHYETHTTQELNQKVIRIPHAHLLMATPKLEAMLIKFKADDTAKKEEAVRLRKIMDLERQLAELKG